MTWRFLTIVPWICASLALAQSPSELSPQEKQAIADTLFVANMSPRDLEFERKPFQDRYRTPLIDLALDKPLDAADALMGMHRAGATSSVTQLLELARTRGLGDGDAQLPPTGIGLPTLHPEVPPEIAPYVNLLVQALATANAHVREALAGLSAEERRALIDGLPQWAVESEKVEFAFVKAKPLDQKTLLDLLAKVDLKRIRAAAVRLSASVDEAALGLRRVQTSWTGRVKFRSEGVIVVLAGRGNDTHSDLDAHLTIDLGGDDLYLGRHGVGIAYSGVLIDLGGNDRYQVPDLSVGAGLLGIGIARDVGGLDLFRGRSLCFGAGLAGVGLLAKEGGHDIYRSTALTQGFGQFGIGLLVDTNGNEDYEAKLFAQGSARTQGVGWLIDRAGDDRYRAGGLVLNSPLFSDVHYSFSQGFGSGYREDTGGISGGAGLLTDLAGDDAYLGETYCQAASYWYSVGSLYDGVGHDTYSAYHYAQASAMHITGAYLFDLAGDDGYLVKFGACQAIGHDYGVAMLLDRAGNDVYAARDSNPAVGNANGLGIFVDAAGEDRYQGPPGVGNAGRGTGSLAVFVDMSGQDLYRADILDGQAATRAAWGVAYDREDVIRRPETPENDEPTGEQAKPGTRPRPTNSELESIYRKATQWGVGTAQAEVQRSLNELIGIGLPAFQWMVENRLARADRLQLRAFAAVMTAVGDPARQLVVSRLTADNENEVRNALNLVIEGRVKEAGPMLMGTFRRPNLVRLGVRAAGVIRERSVVGELLPLCLNEDRLLAVQAMIALSQIGDETAYPTAEALVTSPELPVRKAALDLIAKFPGRAVETSRRLADQPDERTARIGIELKGMLGLDTLLSEVGERLLDPRPGVRIAAMQALNGRFPAQFRTALQTLRNDPIPAVRAVASRIDPGR